ncbi:NUDIX hydrolase [Liberiplasma polymorphum]|uniref:NUDIX hydrolase n=1 Tax=Liberiplasma polymorphum TaxID=3374570 RepID=UPI0037741383
MEKFDIYDHYGRQTGKTSARGSNLKKGEYFPVVHIWIKDQDGSFLIQQRAKKTDPVPYQWAIASGLVQSGESPIESAIRETREEIGLSFNEDDLKLLNKVVTSEGRYQTITYIYLIETTIDQSKIVLDKEEVLNIQKVSLQTIKKMIQENTFWDYPKLLRFNEYFSLLESS